MQIAVCDDEKETRNMLAEKIERFYPNAGLSLYQSGEELLRADSQPDILFLDIQMTGKDGMETARELRRRQQKTIIIFVTALDDFVFEAFDVGAFHYLVKPFQNGKLIEVLLNAVKQYEEQKKLENTAKERQTPSLTITTGGQHFTVELEDIVYAEVFDRKIIIHTMDADIEYYGKMKDLEQKAGDEFYRPHRAYLVNFKYVRRYDAAVAGFGAGQIVKAYIYKNENMSLKEMFMLIVPSITGMTGYGIMQYYQSYLEISVGEAISGAYHILAFLHFGISIVTIVVMTVLFQNIKARQEEKLQNELLSAQIESTEKHIAQVESLYQNIRSIKHDMTNHILTLEGLYAGGQREEAEAYGAELKNLLSEMTGEIKSGNPVTDVILQEQKKEAEKRNIRFRTDFYYPKGSRINAFDISVILNNALQNAMENTNGDEPYISVHSYHRDNAYMIEICNSFTGDLQWDTENELPVTTKRKADGHGYGLVNIRRVAEKYSGDIAIDVKNGAFCISIMLMMDSG